MKKPLPVMLLFAVLSVLTVGCSMGKEMEVQFGQAQLIKIDTLYRYPDRIKQLTWKDENNIQYTSIANMQEVYKVGLRMRVLRQR
jgi:hypothetical protein